MIISDTKKFIFIHIPKTGGMSVRNSLEKYATVGVWKGRTPFGGTPQTNPNMAKHAKARIIKSNVNWPGYFTFSFVRNPWSWLVSGYHYARKDKRDWRNKQANMLSFKDYLIWSLSSDDRRHTTLRLGQFDFISDNGKVIVDYVGKLECIASNFSHICNKLGINENIAHLNKTKHKDYRAYYDSTLIDLVYKHFKNDIEHFNYTF